MYTKDISLFDIDNINVPSDEAYNAIIRNMGPSSYHKFDTSYASLDEISTLRNNYKWPEQWDKVIPDKFPVLHGYWKIFNERILIINGYHWIGVKFLDKVPDRLIACVQDVIYRIKDLKWPYDECFEYDDDSRGFASSCHEDCLPELSLTSIFKVYDSDQMTFDWIFKNNFDDIWSFFLPATQLDNNRYSTTEPGNLILQIVRHISHTLDTRYLKYDTSDNAPGHLPNDCFVVLKDREKIIQEINRHLSNPDDWSHQYYFRNEGDRVKTKPLVRPQLAERGYDPLVPLLKGFYKYGYFQKVRDNARRFARIFLQYNFRSLNAGVVRKTSTDPWEYVQNILGEK